MSVLLSSDSLPLLLLVFIAVSLLLHGAWLIWDEKVRRPRRLGSRWSKFHTGFAPASRSGRGDLEAPGVTGVLAGTAAREQGLLARLERPFREAGLTWRASRLLPLTLVMGLAALSGGVLLGVPLFAPLPLLALLVASPWLYAARLRRIRAARIQQQLGDAVDLVARALRAGHALASALRMVADQAPAPIGPEFAGACEQIGFGVPADEALRQMAARSQSEDLRYFTIAVLLQRETGGNLAELLDNIAALVRQRQQLRQSVRALSAEGRLSAWILGILPFALAGVISLINPDLLSLLWTDPAGRVISLGALLMMAAGILIMRQMVRVRA